MDRLKTIVRDGRLIGHGQQIAAVRRREEAARRPVLPPPAKPTRLVLRRALMKADPQRWRAKWRARS